MEKHERLREARIKAGFASAADAARRAGIPYGTYSGHENGSRGIKNKEIFKYAKIFKTSAEWLLFGTDHKKQPPEYCELMGVGGHLPLGEIELYIEDEVEAEIPIPYGILGGVSYIKVKGRHLRGVAEEGWLIFADSKLTSPINIRPGTLCVCLLHNELCCIRFVYPTSEPQMFDLEFPSMGTERGVNVTAVSEILMIATSITVSIMEQIGAIEMQDFLKASE